jgi:5-formyltetrahydrofolate cyclo-ligase
LWLLTIPKKLSFVNTCTIILWGMGVVRMMSAKHELRKRLLQQRGQMEASDWRFRSQAVSDRLAGWDLLQSVHYICAYFAIKNEPDLSSLWQKFPHKAWYFPRCQDRTLAWFRVDPLNIARDTTIGKYGIITPHAHLPQLPITSIDLILVPSVAVTIKGDRLGYGGGFYDRALASYSGMTAGIIFHEFIVPALPVEPWDVPLRGIGSDRGVFLTK